MRLLLDTHIFLWYITNDSRLPRYAADAIRDKDNDAFLSVVSIWEALVKHQSGKLPLPEPADDYIDGRREEHRIATIPLETKAVAWLLRLPAYHRDPFDRMLICQALRHDLTIVTVDDQIRRYSVAILSPA